MKNDNDLEIKDLLYFSDQEKDQVLERFIKEHFDFKSLVKAGFFTKEMKKNYKAQADRICHFFGYKTIFEYGAEEVRCHISYVNGKRPPNEPFVTVIPSIYE